jgi:AraC family transcriptional regulator
MDAGFAAVTEDDGVRITTAEVDGLTLSELGFPPDYVQAPFEPELPYLALVLDGSMEKTFALRTLHFARASALTMPAGARHGARFGSEGARILIVRPRDASSPVAQCLRRFVPLHGRGFGWLACRLSGELRASDAAAPLAAAGLALQLLAAAGRETGDECRAGRPPVWLRSAEELLRARPGRCLGLGELAAAVDVHPAHLARAFRARHGVSVGEYGRQARLAWAASEVAGGERPLAEIAAEAGFADQSHFTRLFRRYVGTTPAQFRAETRHVPG